MMNAGQDAPVPVGAALGEPGSAVEAPAPAAGKMSGPDFWRKLGAPQHIVAPMVDQSELAFRMMCRKYGAELAVTPMIHSRLYVSDRNYRREIFSTCPEDRPLVVQFCGNDPQTVLKAACMIQDQCDAVDLNLGCPQNIARRGNYGAFLAQDVPLVCEIVRTLADSPDLRVPITCKIRLRDTYEETLAYALALQDAGCKLLSVHARSRQQDRRGVADWEAIRRIKQVLSIPVVANGNIRSLADVRRCLHVTGACLGTRHGIVCAPRVFLAHAAAATLWDFPDCPAIS